MVWPLWARFEGQVSGLSTSQSGTGVWIGGFFTDIYNQHFVLPRFE